MPAAVTRYGADVGLTGKVQALERHRGALLAGTSQGLLRLHPGQAAGELARFERVAGLKDQVWSTAPVEGDLLVASSGGILRLRDDEVREVVDQRAFVLLPSSARPGVVWAGTTEGVLALEKDEAGVWTVGAHLAGVTGDVRFLVESGAQLWIGLNPTGVAAVGLSAGGEAPPVRTYGAESGHGLAVGDTRIFALGESVVFASGDRILRFDSEADRFVPDAALEALAEDVAGNARPVQRLAADQQGDIWLQVGRENGGAVRLEADGWGRRATALGSAAIGAVYAILPSAEIIELLNDLFSAFDAIASELEVEKIKTIGDAYMAVSGLPERSDDHADRVVLMAVRMLGAISDLNQRRDTQLQLRVGVHSGPVVAGVIGRRKFAYDLWGDTVNTASRMESHGVPGAVQISAATHGLLIDDSAFEVEERGLVEVKGRGSMATWLVRGRAAPAAPTAQ